MGGCSHLRVVRNNFAFETLWIECSFTVHLHASNFFSDRDQPGQHLVPIFILKETDDEQCFLSWISVPECFHQTSNAIRIMSSVQDDFRLSTGDNLKPARPFNIGKSFF